MKIESYETLSALLSAALAPGVLTGGIPSPEECRREIEAGTLRAGKAGEGVILFRDRGAFVRLNVLLVPPVPAVLPPLSEAEGKTCVAEFAGRAGDAKKTAAEEIFLRSGFGVICRRIRMSRPRDLPVPPGFLRPADLAVGEAGEEDGEAVGALLEGAFDPLSGCLPSAPELREILAEGNILVARIPGTGEAAGILHRREVRGAAEIRHLAAAPPFRRRGIARALIGRFLADSFPSRAVVWLREDNEAAAALYRSAGFSPDGWTSSVLCRRKESTSAKE